VIGARTGIVVSSVAAIVCSTSAFAEKTTAEYANGTTRPRSIALMPVDATVTRAKVVESEGLVDDGLVYGELFNSQVRERMTAKGYKVVVVDADRINTDPKLQELVVEATRGFKDMMGKYKPKKLEARQLNAGDPARLLADYLGVDALAFSTLSMTITKAGKAIFAGFTGGSTQGTSSNLEIVNGKTGDLEAFFFGVALVGPGDKTDEEMAAYVHTCAERTMNRMPGSDPSSRIEVATSDDDVLDEAEKTLKR